MPILEQDDQYTCCLPYLDGSKKVLLGTQHGFIYEGTIQNVDLIKSIPFEDQIEQSVNNFF